MNYKDIILEKNGPSGRMFNEKYVKSNYVEIYDEVIQYCEKNLNDLSFKEKVYHYVNDINYKILCANPNCNNEVNFKNSTLGYYKHCSIGCISSNPEVKNIKEIKSIEKFGTKTPAESEIIKNKMIKTNNERYGSNSPMQNDEIRKKSINTLMKNYGVDNPNKSEELVKKRIASFKKSDHKINYLKTMLDRYGVKYPYQVSEFLEKSRITFLKNHGVEYPYQDLDIMKKTIDKKMKTWMDKILLNNSDIINIDYNNREYIIKCDCNKDHNFIISFSLLKSRRQYASHLCTVCFPEYFNQTSMLEQDLINFIKDNYDDEIITNSKKIIKPFELDIYLPKLKKAFEFNGLHWHSDKYKNNNYHFNKNELCYKKNIKLIQIYEDDWNYMRDVVKSMILNEINKKIYISKNFEIKEIIDVDLIIDFMNNNSLTHNYYNDKLSIGLFYDNILIHLLMIEKNNENYDIVGFYSKNYTNIKNGYEILFNYFIEKYNPSYIDSIIEKNWYDDIYFDLGFEIESIIDPDFKFIINNKRKSNGDDNNKKIYDSGKIKLIWKKDI